MDPSENANKNESLAEANRGSPKKPAEIKRPQTEATQSSKFDFYEAKGNLFFQKKQFDVAIENYRLALEISPTAHLYLRLAEAFKHKKNQKAYLEAQYQAIVLAPKLATPEAAQKLRNLLREYYQKSLEHQAADAQTHVKLAALYAEQDQSKDARTHYEKAISLESNFTSAHTGLASLHSHHQRWDSAIASYEKALSLAPQNRDIKIKLGKAHFEAGRYLKSRGKTGKAGWAYLKALQLNPNLQSAYIGLRYDVIGHATLRKRPQHQKLLTKTEQVCKAIIKQHPDLILAYTTLAYTLTQAGKISAAADFYRQINTKVAHQYLTNANVKQSETEYRNPDFIIIGTQKGGTTSLYQYLRRHPKILSPVEKEINFFSWEYEKGLKWYLSHFPPMPCHDNWITGEVSPNYLYSSAAPKRILEFLPEIKLGVILRNPVDRAVSHYYMMERKGEEKRKFSDIVEQEIKILTQETKAETIPWNLLHRCPYLGSSMYYHHLVRWFDTFSPEKLFVIQSEELLSTPDQTLKALHAFLGVEHHTEAEYPKHHVGKYPPISEGLNQTLSDFFAPHIDKLENKLSRSFNWL